MNTFFSSIRLFRPANIFLGGGTVIISAAIVGSLSQTELLIRGIIVVMAFTGATNALNDYLDLETDMINKKTRPLIEGTLLPRTAVILSISLYTIGTFVALSLPKPALIISVGIAMPLMLIYNFWLKGTVLIGNVVVSVIIAMTFLFSGALFSKPALMITPALLAFAFTLTREFIKDIADEKGDRKVGLKTLPVKLGTIVSSKIAIGMISLLLVSIVIPFCLGLYSKEYLITAMLGIGIPLAYIISLLVKSPTSNNCHKASQLLKACVFIGLLAVYLG